MSEPFVGTDTHEDRPCNRCGVVVRHSLTVGIYHGTEHWRKDRHRAPCGLWCFGGGAGPVQLPDYKARNMHGLEGEPCPVCHAIRSDEAEDIRRGRTILAVKRIACRLGITRRRALDLVRGHPMYQYQLKSAYRARVRTWHSLWEEE